MNDLLAKLYYMDSNLYWAETISNRAVKDTLAGTQKQNGYREIQYKKKRYYVHRVIYTIFYEDIPPNCIIDHIDQDPSNNDPTNLRCIPQSLNLHNTTKRSTNTSGYKGISWDKKQNKWVAALSYRGIRIYRKYFDNILEANNALIIERDLLYDRKCGREVSGMD